MAAISPAIAPGAQYPQNPASPANALPASVDEVRKAPSGWNDPPPVHSVSTAAGSKCGISYRDSF